MSQASIVEFHPQPWVATFATCTQSYDDPSALSLIRLGGRVANGLVVCETALGLSFVSSQVSPLQASAGEQDDSRMLENFRSKAPTSAASFSASASKTKPAFGGGTGSLADERLPRSCRVQCHTDPQTLDEDIHPRISSGPEAR
ncbi:uncharacterized protein SEPMUDRAFT_112661 [Sphaerulina musiva SO2202]|uniref:Uncharacterized protein n=1 Tax=Sphaerulina musiva (strain SO2202) TaxID=692275 RepID=N1QHF4_SPHMS|nr:uncharacterized protein SEPMUDRAFT_112661 [Sphaerulina musiva SO2202]EMF16620.1 hypothetical protein SEPMUDRAFT_112661 [Sphaerulina musiva SO2202]